MCDLFPNLLSSRQPTPMLTQKSRQPEALVNRRDVIFMGALPVRTLHPINQQGFNVRFYLKQYWIERHNFSPGGGFEPGFNRPGRTGIERNKFLGRTVVKDESQLNRNMQTLPLRVTETKIRHEERTQWHAPIFRLAPIAEEDCTGLTDADQRSLFRLDQMLMRVEESCAAKIAQLIGCAFALAGEPAQRGERVVAHCLSHFSHLRLRPE